jgi:hypothetical protein
MVVSLRTSCRTRGHALLEQRHHLSGWPS